MQTLSTHAAIQHQALHHPDLNLRKLITQRILELSEYTDDVAELMFIVILDPSDRVQYVQTPCGLAVGKRLADVIESQPGWYEITVVLSESGFGSVLYVPKHPDSDQRLLALLSAFTGDASEEVQW